MCTLVALLAVGTTGSTDNIITSRLVREPRDTYLDAYMDSHGLIIDRDSPPTGVVEAPSDPHANPESSSSYNPTAKPYYNVSPSISSAYSLPSRNYGAPSPVYVPPSTSYGTPSTSYGTPATSYGTPASSYGTPASSYGSPSTSHGFPPTSYGPPSTSYGAPTASYGIPSSYYNAPSSGYGVPAPAYGTPAPMYGVPTPKPQHVSMYDTLNRGMASIPLHTLAKILLKVLIFKLIVKFIAVMCVLLFWPKLHSHGHKDNEEEEEERMFNRANGSKFNRNVKTFVVLHQ